MTKRLNTETKFKNGGFKVKIGTTNRLNPNTIYIDLGGYIIPQEDKTSYDENVLGLDKMLNKSIKKQLIDNKYFDKKYICVTETAQDRMKKGKSSYISLQCHLRQTEGIDANELVDRMVNLTPKLFKEVKKSITYSGFTINKNEKKDIYKESILG